MKENINIPKGYNQTKLGIIPNDWKLKKLDDLGSFSKGKGISKAQLIENGLPAIRYGELYTEHHIYIKEFKSFISQETADNSKQIKQNDILFAGSGETLNEIGKCATYIGNETVYAGGDIIILTPHSDIDSLYLSYSLNSDIVLRQRRKLGQGHSVVHIYSSGLKTLPIPLPPLAEQKRIAQILTTWDKAINNYQLLIINYQLKKKGLMQKLLAPKKDWKEVRLGDLGIIQTGNTPSKQIKDYWGGEYCWATADDMNSKYIYDTFQKLSDVGFKKARIAKRNSILVTCIASIGKNSITKIDTGFNQQINSITPNKNYNTDFIYYNIEKNTYKLITFAGAGAMLMLNKNTFMSIKLKFPDIETQTKIANILSSADKEIEILEKQLSKLKEQKKGLMQVLLSGQKRVKIMDNE